ncbi:beta-1,2-xylosyltransferease XAX1-like [Triticum aestivum]|uniref:beta-1,2-xylosyltransferease XAX1-like n=1 Tax=Triticum aestivum TaxID=4565 RepID=UPI001D026FAD|nr:beta-1,2-xylosyltransferease XAX1-like [Triticum aestivum]
MAIPPQHSRGSRAITTKPFAAVRERKSRLNYTVAAKNLGKLEPRQLALRLRQLAACLLVLVACAGAAKLLSTLLSPRVPWIEPGSRAASSWDRRANVDADVPQGHSTSPVLAKSGSDPSESSPELATVAEIEVPKPKGSISCDDKTKDEGFPYARPIVCKMSGDVRIAPGSSSVILTMPLYQSAEGRRVRPYARHDDSLPPLVREVAIKTVANGSDAPECSVRHGDIPAVVFSVGGYTGNFFHDMSDVLIPLYLTSFQFKGRVQFFVTDYKQWWVKKYKPILQRLSRYDIVDFDSNDDVHCFHHVILGLVRDRDLIIRRHRTRNPKGHSMVGFKRLLRRAYGLRRDRPLALGENPGKKPRMLIISRRGTRRLLNLHQVEAMATLVGFDVTVSEARDNGIKRFAETVNSCDVLVAVHGAGLTNQVFLPARAVVVQIVPWGGMEWMATNFYGEPARGMGLRYLEYRITGEENSLAGRYPRDHAVFRDPMAIHAQGWKALAEVVMTQDVSLDLDRFRPTLLRALDLLQD